MLLKKSRNNSRLKRHRRVRKKVHGTLARPRLNVFRSLTNIYVQVIDDLAGQTLVAASTLESASKEKEKSSAANQDAARRLGGLIAERCLEKGINTVIFDRGGYLYHGRVKALAEGAREKGLKF